MTGPHQGMNEILWKMNDKPTCVFSHVSWLLSLWICIPPWWGVLVACESQFTCCFVSCLSYITMNPQITLVLLPSWMLIWPQWWHQYVFFLEAPCHICVRVMEITLQAFWIMAKYWDEGRAHWAGCVIDMPFFVTLMENSQMGGQVNTHSVAMIM